MRCKIALFVLFPLLLSAEVNTEYDLRISYTGDKNAPMTIKTHYCKGTTTKCGRQVKIAQNGTLLFKAFYKNGKYDGEVLSYYANGALQERRTYTEGIEVGKRVIYYNDGKIQSEQEYAFNKREGEGKKYYDNGVLQAEFSYKDDKLNGVRKEFDKQGNITYETLYKEGKKQTMKKYTNNVVIEEKNCCWSACY